MRILVTGASGFVGSHIAEFLAERGHELRLTLRPRSKLDFLKGMAFERAEGDIRDAAAMAKAVAGIETVIHAAGLTSALTEAELHAVNCGGVANLVQAAVGAGVRRFVYVSSLAARGPAAGMDLFAPAAAVGPVSAYGRSKLAGEQAALQMKEAIDVVIVRPAIVYGPRDRGLLPFYKLVKLGLMPVFGDGLNRISWVHARDTASAIATLATGNGPSGCVYHLSDGQPYTWLDLGEALARGLNKKRLLRLHLPPIFFRSLGIAGGLAGLLTRKSMPMTPDKFNEMRQRNWVCGYDELSARFGWKPAVSLDAGVRETAQWYRQQGWL